MLQLLAGHTTLALTPPPYFGVPSLFDAVLGWFLGIVLLIAPSALLAARSHTVLGHWMRHFAQWHRRAWWAVTLGSIALASGVFVLLGALPAWQAHWQAWYSSSLAQNPANLSALTWLSQTQTQFAHLVQVAAVVVTLGGILVLLLGMWRMYRRVLIRRQAVAPTSEWMMAPPVTRSHFDG